jgi:hypothetical protein
VALTATKDVYVGHLVQGIDPILLLAICVFGVIASMFRAAEGDRVRRVDDGRAGRLDRAGGGVRAPAAGLPTAVLVAEHDSV